MVVGWGLSLLPNTYTHTYTHAHAHTHTHTCTHAHAHRQTDRQQTGTDRQIDTDRQMCS